MAAIEPSNIESESESLLTWDEYFMAIAFLAAKRSKDPVTKVGACIVNKDERVISTGYNGMPNDCSDKDFPWTKEKPANEFGSKSLYVCHAELNAILNNNSKSVKGCKIYVGLFPCNECAKMIIQSGIKEIIYMSDKHQHKSATKASKRMLSAANIAMRQYKPKNPQIVIDFNDIDRNTGKDRSQPMSQGSQSKLVKK